MALAANHFTTQKVVEQSQNEINYKAPSTLARFLKSDGKIRVVYGPFGSGKSVACVMELFRRAQMQAPGRDGIRRTRFAVVRNTTPQLRDTTIKTVHEWFPPGVFGVWRSTTKDYFIKFGDVESQWMFRPLDEPSDVRNLLSLELTGAWLNECREIHPDLFIPLTRRLGRYPSKRDGGCSWHGLWADTNPPSIGSWWYNQMEHRPPFTDNGWEVFKQPSGRSSKAENIENLPDDYYSTVGLTDDFIKVYIDGEYGRTLDGLPVFGMDFHRHFHVSFRPLNPIRDSKYPVVVGIDLGLSPAAVFFQVQPTGQISLLAELTTHDKGPVGLRQFIPRYLTPILLDKFRGCTMLYIIDPAGKAASQHDSNETAISVFEEFRISVEPARTNLIEPRLEVWRSVLAKQIDGHGFLQIDPECTTMIHALEGGYIYKTQRDGTVLGQPDPLKNDYSHIVDSGGYALMHIEDGGGAIFDEEEEMPHPYKECNSTRNLITGY